MLIQQFSNSIGCKHPLQSWITSVTAKIAFNLTLLSFCLLAASARAQQETVDMHLEDVGFVIRGATVQQLDRLRDLLPPHRFVARTTSGRRCYLYVDPDLCKCVFLGDEAAMQSYKALVSLSPTTGLPGVASPSDLAIEEMNPRVNESIAPGDILDY